MRARRKFPPPGARRAHPAGKPDPASPALRLAAYQAVYNDVKVGNITPAQAIIQMGALIATSHVSTRLTRPPATISPGLR